MMDQLIAMKDKIVAFWNKYTTRQKTVIICVVLGVFFALVLLSYFLTRPVYTHLATFRMLVLRILFPRRWRERISNTRWIRMRQELRPLKWNSRITPKRFWRWEQTAL